MTFTRLLAVAMLLAAGPAARAEYILSLPDGAARVGAPLRADLTILNDSDAESRLLGLRERIVHGAASFAELAKAHPADLSAAKGGDLGWLSPGDTVPEFERAMNALKPGEVSMPVHSPFGWHLIQVEARRLQDVSDERKRTAARNALRERKADEAFEDWLRQLRDRTYVEYRTSQE